MSYEIVWSPQALAALYRVHWRTGAVIDGAVAKFSAFIAERAGPKLERHRIRVAGHDAVLVVDREAPEVRVVGLYLVR